MESDQFHVLLQTSLYYCYMLFQSRHTESLITLQDEKIQAALDYYESLDDGQRTYGYISVVEETGSGQIKPSYSHNVPPISDGE